MLDRLETADPAWTWSQVLDAGTPQSKVLASASSAYLMTRYCGAVTC